MFVVLSVIVLPQISVAEVAPETDKIGLVPSVMIVAPVTVRVPLSKIFNVVAVAVRSPPIVDVAKLRPASFTIVALPVPFVVREIEPSTARVTMLITPLLLSVTATRLPPTVTIPLSVLPLSVIPDALPLTSVKLPPTDEPPAI